MEKRNCPQYLAIIDGLSRANLVVCNKVDPTIIDEMALVFFDELFNFSAQQIEFSFRAHLRQSRYMPTVAEIYRLCQQDEKERKRIEYQNAQEKERQREEMQRLSSRPVNVEKMRKDIEKLKKTLAGAFVVPGVDIEQRRRKARRQAKKLLENP